VYPTNQRHNSSLPIAEVAKRTGLSKDTVRHYQKARLRRWTDPPAGDAATPR
jgi:MerR family regulatory protein